MGQLNGKSALITGGNSGIGLATAQRFYAEGAKVAIAGRDAQKLAAARATMGDDVVTIVADVSRFDEVQRMVQEADRALNGLDIVFANAGVAPMAPYDQVDEAYLDNLLAINVKGAFFTAQQAVKALRKNGTIVFNTSVVNARGFPGLSIYSATKGAVRAMARALAAELVGQGIRVNAVSPGPIETPIFGKMGMTAQQQSEFGEQIQQSVPMGRFGQASEIANAVLFLASDQASYITGFELAVDGGFSQI